MWDEQHDKSDTDSDEEGKNMYGDMMTYEQIQQMFNEDSDDDDDEFLGFESILLISVHLIRLFDLHASIYGMLYLVMYVCSCLCLSLILLLLL